MSIIKRCTGALFRMNKKTNVIYVLSECDTHFHIYVQSASHSFVTNNVFDCKESPVCIEYGPNQWTLTISFVISSFYIQFTYSCLFHLTFSRFHQHSISAISSSNT